MEQGIVKCKIRRLKFTRTNMGKKFWKLKLLGALKILKNQRVKLSKLIAMLLWLSRIKLYKLIKLLRLIETLYAKMKTAIKVVYFTDVVKEIKVKVKVQKVIGKDILRKFLKTGTKVAFFLV